MSNVDQLAEHWSGKPVAVGSISKEGYNNNNGQEGIPAKIAHICAGTHHSLSESR